MMKEVVVSPDFWPIISTGVVILIAIAASNRSLRREMNERIDGLSGRMDGLSGRMDGLNGRMDRLNELLGDVRERLGRVEGLLEAIGFVRRRASKKRGDQKHLPPLPRS